MGLRYQGNSKFKSVPKHLVSDETATDMLDKLEAILPMTRQQIINRAVEAYFLKKTARLASVSIMYLLVRQGHKCHYCPKIISSKTATIDHMTPLSRGGTNDLENLVAACDACNNEKESMTVPEFFLYRRQIGIDSSQ